MRSFAVAFLLLLPFALHAQQAKPIRAKELKEFLGPVSPTAISWTKYSGPDFDVYNGHANPPLSGDVSFYLGGWPSFNPEPEGTIVKGKLGIFPVQWHKSVASGGSVRQHALIRLDDYWKVDISVRAKGEKDLHDLLAVVSQLPTFTQKPKPVRSQ